MCDDFSHKCCLLMNYSCLNKQNFQHLEEQRIDFFRDSVWKCTNVDSKACVDHDEVMSL